MEKILDWLWAVFLLAIGGLIHFYKKDYKAHNDKLKAHDTLINENENEIIKLKAEIEGERKLTEQKLKNLKENVQKK